MPFKNVTNYKKTKSNGKIIFKPSTVVADIASICCNQWLSLGAVTMFVRLINDQSTTARVLVFNNLCDISQIKSQLSNLNKNTFERIFIILNVRKDSFSGDTFQSDYGRKGNHYSLLEIDFMMKTVTYFDSKGWTVPKGLESKIYQMIDTVCDQTGRFVSYPMQGAPAKVHHAHSRGQINSSGDHVCSNKCFQQYPVQTCGNICGIIAVTMSAVAALKPKVWSSAFKSTREVPNSENISWLANASNYSSYLRPFLLQSLVEKSFDLRHLGITTNFISDLSKLENGGGAKQGSNHSPKSKLKRPHVPRSALSSVDSSSSSCSFPQSSLSPPNNAKNLSKSEDDPNPNSINSANDSSPPSISDFSNSLGVQTSPKKTDQKAKSLVPPKSTANNIKSNSHHVPRSALSSVNSSSSSCSFPQSSLSPPNNAQNLSKSEDDPNPNLINSANDSSPPSISDFSNSLGLQTSPKKTDQKAKSLVPPKSTANNIKSNSHHCEFCGEEKSSLFALYKHKKKHHQEEYKPKPQLPILCIICRGER